MSVCVDAKQQEITLLAINKLLDFAAKRKKKIVETIEIQFGLKTRIVSTMRLTRLQFSFCLPHDRQYKPRTLLLGDEKAVEEATTTGVSAVNGLEHLKTFNKQRTLIKRWSRYLADWTSLLQ